MPSEVHIKLDVIDLKYETFYALVPKRHSIGGTLFAFSRFRQNQFGISQIVSYSRHAHAGACEVNEIEFPIFDT